MKKEITLVWIDIASLGEDRVWEIFVASNDYDPTKDYFLVEIAQSIQIYEVK